MTRKFSTRAIHDGERPDRATGVHNTPIYQTATFSFDKAEDMAEAVMNPLAINLLPDGCGGIASFRIKGGAAEMNRFADSY